MGKVEKFENKLASSSKFRRPVKAKLVLILFVLLCFFFFLVVVLLCFVVVAVDVYSKLAEKKV